ncbi:hypothetical protein FG379_000569 [Cryptosporidium bovis]|uniref:uncharacterized protein n=1 Tax=Cryptosporidium bovis TaxID=310047 RepID=UPI00351A898D|nr:hypothetical protein FG379_000569 [Cryptosporidium bovis]
MYGEKRYENKTVELTEEYLGSINSDLASLKVKIHEILITYPDGILLSLIEKIFNKYWDKKLSPTIYGYTRILALLLSDDFKDIRRL